MGFPIDLPLGKGMTINYMLCIIALSCFFFWLKCGTVVAVGVQTSFLQPPAPVKRGYCKKCDRKKTIAGWIVRRPTKRPCKPRGTRGGDFWRPGIFYKNTGYSRHSSNKFGSALACLVFALRSCP